MGICLLLAASAVFAQAPPATGRPAAASIDPPALVRVHLGGDVSIRALQEAGLDLVRRGGVDGTLILAWPGDEAALRRLGARFEVIDAAPGATAAARTRREMAGRPTAVGTPVRSAIREDGRRRIEMLPPFGSGSMGGFWTLDEVKMKLDALVADDAQDLVADQLDTLGTSVLGRPIWGLEVGKHVAGPDSRPVVYFNALTHAREPEGMQALFWFIDDLIAGYGSDPWKTYLLENRRLYLCPVVNPDGYQVNVDTYVNSGGLTFGLWRKNVRDNDASGSFNSADGVDLNRNFGYQWGFNNVGSSGNTFSVTYRGPAPFSEPESQAQRDRVVALAPKTAMSFHTHGDLWLHAWGYQVPATADSALFHEWNDEATAGLGWSAGQSTRVLYEVNGEFNDWCYGETVLKPRLYSWTPELGSDDDGFWPAPSRIVPIANQALRGCYTVAAIAGPYVRAQRADWSGGALTIGAVGSVAIEARNIGRAATATGLNATLVSLDPGAEVLSGPLAYPSLASWTSGAAGGNAEFLVATVDTLTPGRLLRFRVDFRDDAGLFCRDTVEIPAGVPTFLLADPCDDLTNWFSSGGWASVAGPSWHPSRYFSDSPGTYAANTNLRLTLKGTLDLSGVTHAYVNFDARWALEGDYDGCLLEASPDSVSWTPLAGRSTRIGVFSPQPAGQPIYAGHRNLWGNELADLTPFCGAGDKIRLRFRLVSDGGLQMDGMNLDSLRIAIYDPAAQPAPVAVSPSPGSPFGFDTPSPNPARSGATFAWTLPVPGTARLEILDLSGRRISTVASGSFGAHRYTMRWDLRGDDGSRVPPGVYFARLTSNAGSRLHRFVVLR